MSFPGAKCFQGGTRWKYRARKWYAIRKSLGITGLQHMKEMLRLTFASYNHLNTGCYQM